MSTHEPSEGRPTGYPQGPNEDRGQSGRRGPHADRQDGRTFMENLCIEHQLHGTCSDSEIETERDQGLLECETVHTMANRFELVFCV